MLSGNADELLRWSSQEGTWVYGGEDRREGLEDASDAAKSH